MIDVSNLRLATLSENTAKSLWLMGEWGWSILVEAEDERILFDTGLRLSATHNAEMMGIDLTTIDRIALSHGHVDHTGGLRDILERMGSEVGRSNFLDRHERIVDIICHPDAWGQKFIRYEGETDYGFRGIPFRKEELESRQGARFIESREPFWLTEDIAWSGEVPMTNDFEQVASICFLKQEDGSFIPDPLTDDAALYIKTNLGLVVILGCAHRGMINTIHHAREVTGMERVHMVVGGTHLVKASQSQLDSTVRELRRMNVEKVGVSHCTGQVSAAKLSAALGEEVFFYNNAGNIVTFDGA